jgi:hypothetical protein
VPNERLAYSVEEVLPDIQDEHGGVTHDERLETVIPGVDRAAGAHRVGRMVTVAGRARRMTRRWPW